MPIDNVEIVMKKTSEIIPYWRNPRKNDKTVEALMPVIEKNGFNVPIVIDKNNVVVKGHARLKAAKRLGMEEVPCIVSNAPDDVIKADRIADNKIQEMSSWDFAKRDLELERLGDSMTFGRLFRPEELDVGNEVFDVPTFEYKATALDFSQTDAYAGGDDEPTRHEHPQTAEVFVDIPEGYAEAKVVSPPADEAGFVPEQIQAQRKFRTLCPYCGKVVTIDV